MSIDSIWAEASIYAIGLKRALTKWHPWLSVSGCMALSGFVLWAGDLSKEAREFWAVVFPEMASEAEVGSRAETAGYRLVVRFRMSKEAYDVYYVPLEARVDEHSGIFDAKSSRSLRALVRKLMMHDNSPTKRATLSRLFSATTAALG